MLTLEELYALDEHSRQQRIKGWTAMLANCYLEDEPEDSYWPQHAQPGEMASILQLDPHDSSANPPWLYVKDGQPMVKGSLVPGAKRILTQNSPMTKDYRPDRLNIFYDETSRKITGVTFV
ncbi:hypothetical protein IWW52_005816 [Coemansia sp. RSA 2704]|nr:hypothetical protein IWW52_005816 [Coemansia sp. RSA 2704]